jgi:hypothetical protein
MTTSCSKRITVVQKTGICLNGEDGSTCNNGILIIFGNNLKIMGTVYADIELINAIDLGLVRSNRMDKDEVRRIRVNMLANSGAYMMAINEIFSTNSICPL